MPPPSPHPLPSFPEFVLTLVRPITPSASHPASTEDCPICLHPYYHPNFDLDVEAASYGTCEEPVQTACGHVLGSSCLFRWVVGSIMEERQQATCPLCRGALYEMEGLEGLVEEMLRGALRLRNVDVDVDDGDETGDDADDGLDLLAIFRPLDGEPDEDEEMDEESDEGSDEEMDDDSDEDSDQEPGQESNEESDEDMDEYPNEETDQEGSDGMPESESDEDDHSEQRDGDDAPDGEHPPDGSALGDEDPDEEMTEVYSEGVEVHPNGTANDGYTAVGSLDGGEYFFEDVFAAGDVHQDMHEDLDEKNDEADTDISTTDPVPAFPHPPNSLPSPFQHFPPTDPTSRLFHLPDRPYTRPYLPNLSPKDLFLPPPSFIPPYPLLFSETAIEKAIAASSLAIRELEVWHQKWMCEIAEIGLMIGSVGFW